MNRVRALRQKLGLSQRALAKAAGTSQQQIGRIELGQSPRLQLALKVSRALQSPAESVFPGPAASARVPRGIDEIVRLAEKILAGLPAATRKKHHGQFVVVDVDSGSCFFSRSDAEAEQAARESNPRARTFGTRVGMSAAYELCTPGLAG